MPTASPLKSMEDAICLSGSGNNCRQTVAFINERIGTTGIDTHKLSFASPFLFG